MAAAGNGIFCCCFWCHDLRVLSVVGSLLVNHTNQRLTNMPTTIQGKELQHKIIARIFICCDIKLCLSIISSLACQDKS
jgi:hypothetical protein